MRAVVAGCACAVVFVACEGTTQPAIEQLAVTPTFLFMEVGETATLEIEGSGDEVTGVEVSDGSVIGLAGLTVEAKADGVARIYLRAGELADTVSVIVGEVRSGQIATGGSSTCALADEGLVFCWGNNWYGQGGSGRPERVIARPRAAEVQEPIKHITVGGSHACALTLTGSALCWGRGDYGQLGDGGQGEHRVAEPVHVQSDERFRMLDAGLFVTCGLTQEGALYCWGLNEGGVAGQPLTTARVPEPRAVVSPLSFVAIAVGGSACGLTASGRVYCWGPNELGQLGVQGPPFSATPVEVPIVAPVKALTVGDMHACALSNSGRAYCWGRNLEGQLGVADVTTTAEPQQVPLNATLVSIQSGGSHTCAVSDTGEGFCWGSNWRGELGRGTFASPPTLPGTAGSKAERVETDLLFRALSPSSEHHTCGVSTDGRVLCWGWNNSGETGTGTNEEVILFPRAVALPDG